MEQTLKEKKWYQSITYWVGLGFIVLGVAHYFKTGDLIKAIEVIGIGLGFIGVRRANSAISSKVL